MTELRVWAPNVQRLRVRTGGADHPMARGADGWWTGPDLAPGTDYGLLVDEDETPLSDPRSTWQPDGVHGLSRMYDQDAYVWRDADWPGRDLTAAVIYELHVGTFTPGATFDSAIERLDHLVRLGVTHVELLPVNDFNGQWNWGYDGVLWYAVHEPYGGPDGLKRFVDAAHAKGLAVLLDVVYNHLGPSGNNLPRYAPYVKTGRNTWGDLINVEEPNVRDYIVGNVLVWLRDFHVDGLRLDAVHALQDGSPTHVLAAMSEATDALAKEVKRPLTLIAESDLNDTIMVSPRPDGYGVHAQWADDVHHEFHALLTGERQGYYGDFGSLPVLEKVLTRVFLHDGTFSTFRGRVHGAPVDRASVEGWRFVVFLQDHDQVGNRAVGDRLPEYTTPEHLRIGAMLLFTTPFTPMLWMGEEWAASTRWPFFTSHPEKELGEAVSKGRLAEFASHGWEDTAHMIDPQDPAAYRTAVLDWDEAETGAHAEMLAFYRALISLRAQEPDLRDHDLTRVSVDYDEDEQWAIVHRGGFRVVINLSDERRVLPVRGQVVLSTSSTAPAVVDGALHIGPHTGAILKF